MYLLQIETVIYDQIQFFGAFALSLALLFFMVRYFMRELEKQRAAFKISIDEHIKTLKESNTQLMKVIDHAADSQKELSAALKEVSAGMVGIEKSISYKYKT